MIDWEKFAIANLDPVEEAFVVYMTYLNRKMPIHLA